MMLSQFHPFPTLTIHFSKIHSYISPQFPKWPFQRAFITILLNTFLAFFNLAASSNQSTFQCHQSTIWHYRLYVYVEFKIPISYKRLKVLDKTDVWRQLLCLYWTASQVLEEYAIKKFTSDASKKRVTWESAKLHDGTIVVTILMSSINM
jgi:hypothetical protein